MYERNKDLILVIFFGFIYYAIAVGLSHQLTQIPVGEYFIFPFVVSIFMGFIVQRSSQILEWPLCFLFGGVIGTVMILPLLHLLGMNFNSNQILETLNHTISWFGTNSALMLIGILLSSFVRWTFEFIMGSLRVH